MKKSLKRLMLFSIGCVFLPCIAIGQNKDKELVDLAEKVKKQAVEGRSELVGTSNEFRLKLEAVDLSPSADLHGKIAALQGICGSLLESLGKKKMAADDSEIDAVASATKALLKKLDGAIEENYQFQLGTGNVAPPHGIPNSAAGMDPDAISDPQLKKQYLDAITKEKEKQYKNNQQSALKGARKIIILYVYSLGSSGASPKFSKEDLINKFTEDGESRTALRKVVSPDSEK